MLIAQQKRKTNIAEYILYIWQVEDLLRALNFGPEQIGKMLVARFDADADTRLEIYDWYKNLALMMQKEQVTKSGHVQFVVNLVDDLNRFHMQLLQSGKDPQYPMLFQMAKPVINEFRDKSLGKDAHDVQLGFQALYSMMLLRLQKREITAPTKAAVGHISKMIGHLSARYLQYENGKFEL
jgi:hypothetical protein